MGNNVSAKCILMVVIYVIILLAVALMADLLS